MEKKRPPSSLSADPEIDANLAQKLKGRAGIQGYTVYSR